MFVKHRFAVFLFAMF